MKKKISCLALCMLCIPAFAQDVPPPPRPTDAAPVVGRGAKLPALSLEENAKLLQDTLNSIGTVYWNQTTRDTKTNAVTGPARAFETVVRATVNPGACEMRGTWNSSEDGQTNGTFFLEEVTGISVQASDAYNNGQHPGIQYTMTPTPYSVVFNSTTDIKVVDLQSANRIANALRQLARECRAAPPAPANGGASLQETASFIGDRLNGLGSVNYLATVQNTVTGTTHAPFRMSDQISGAATAADTCVMSFHTKTTADAQVVYEGDQMLSFRRVEKIAVMSLAEAGNAANGRSGNPESSESISPVMYSLVVSDAASRTWDFSFADQDLANRVAKAMLHATELCGGGKSPF